MSRLLVCVNHAAPFHVGGSEKVVQQITDSMRDDYGVECHILTKFMYQSTGEHNGIKLWKCLPTPEEFLDQVQTIDPDYLLTYSDCFGHWPTLLRENEKIRARQSIALVGMNHMSGEPFLRTTFFNKHKQFQIITHSDNYFDYRYCHEKGMPINVIPNGIDLPEFADQGFSFRERYKIDTKKIILCVSNFFPGKGQDHLLQILNRVSETHKDFTAVFICTKVSFFVANNLMQRFETLLRRNSGFKWKFLQDIPRSDTIQAFREADLFTFPSQQEVAPLVVLEAMATHTPWVALNVGNVPKLPGGIVIQASKKIRGQYQYDEEIYKQFAQAVSSILSEPNLASKLSDEGYSYIENHLNWSKIKEQYFRVLTGES